MTDCTTDTGCPNPDVNRHLVEIDAELEKINADLVEVTVRLDNGVIKMSELEATIGGHHLVANEARARFEKKMDDNTASTSEILEIVQALKGFVRVVRAVGRVVTWALAIVAPIVAIWVALKK